MLKKLFWLPTTLLMLVIESGFTVSGRWIRRSRCAGGATAGLGNSAHDCRGRDGIPVDFGLIDPEGYSVERQEVAGKSTTKANGAPDRICTVLDPPVLLTDTVKNRLTGGRNPLGRLKRTVSVAVVPALISPSRVTTPSLSLARGVYVAAGAVQADQPF